MNVMCVHFIEANFCKLSISYTYKGKYGFNFVDSVEHFMNKECILNALNMNGWKSTKIEPLWFLMIQKHVECIFFCVSDSVTVNYIPVII